MLDERINLEEILDSKVPYLYDILSEEKYQQILITMKDICKQLLELAAENASIKTIVSISPRYHSEKGIIDKQSILNTIKQVK